MLLEDGSGDRATDQASLMQASSVQTPVRVVRQQYGKSICHALALPGRGVAGELLDITTKHRFIENGLAEATEKAR